MSATISQHWRVNGTPIYEPGLDTQIEHNDVTGSNSGRTEDGVMHIDWVRRDVVKVHLKWPLLTGRQVEFLMGLLQGREFQFTYWDFGKEHTISAYATQGTYSKHSDHLHASEGGSYKDYSINVIEM